VNRRFIIRIDDSTLKEMKENAESVDMSDSEFLQQTLSAQPDQHTGNVRYFDVEVVEHPLMEGIE